jgi:tetratricopeptide (TPR) repeat protein
MNYYHRLSAAILGANVALMQVQSVQAITESELSKVAKSVTIMIQNVQNLKETGSGVIIKRDGETYTVLTTHHVVEQSSSYRVMTSDDKLYLIDQGSIQAFPGVDLALATFKSSESYSVAKIGDSAQSRLGGACFVSGFPSVTEVRSEPTFYFTPGEIAANASRPLKDGYAIAYNNPTLPGMSGGPVLNAEGELIGIHGRAETAEQLQNSQVRKDIYVLKTELNYAIPINTFLSLAPQVNSTLAFRTLSPSVPSAPKADDFYLQAQGKSRKGDLKGATSDLDQTIRLNPKYVSAYTNRGIARAELGDLKGAIADFEQVIRFAPNSAIAYNNRGFARHESRDNHGAIEDYDQAIRLDPKFAMVYFNRGFARQELGNNQDAINDYDQAIRLDPKSANAYINRGNVRFLLEDRQGALNDYDQAILIDPTNADAYINRGNVRAALGYNDGAFDDYGQAIALDPKKASTYNNRGLLRVELGDNQGALADYDQAIRLNPKLASVYSNRGNAHAALGHSQEAISDFDQAINLNPKLAAAYNSRGRSRYKLGDKQGAISDLSMAAALYKANGNEKRYQSVLKKIQQINER